MKLSKFVEFCKQNNLTNKHTMQLAWCAFAVQYGLLKVSEIYDAGSFVEKRFSLTLSLLSECTLDRHLVSMATKLVDFNSTNMSCIGSLYHSLKNINNIRLNGIHYTSKENVLRVIYPLFLSDLKSEFGYVKDDFHALVKFHKKLSCLSFLDPACGCGDFLLVIFQELHKLEKRVIKRKLQLNKKADTTFLVSVRQFNGIELSKSSASVCEAVLFLYDYSIHDNKCIKPTILRDNALRVDWIKQFPSTNYIVGNPPFVGARKMSKQQKEDVVAVFNNSKGCKDLDYCSCWFMRASQIISKYKNIKTAFIAINSITLGIQATPLWKPIFERYKVSIFFCYTSFTWNNDATINDTNVPIVILGLCSKLSDIQPTIYYKDGTSLKVSHINQYLLDADSIYFSKISNPICKDAPTISAGAYLLDNGLYLFTLKEKRKFLKKEPQAEQYFYRCQGSWEFLNNKKRYVLCLEDLTEKEIQNSFPECYKIVQKVKKFRQSSKRLSTRKQADYPTKFISPHVPNKNLLIIPRTTSGKRNYLPIGFVNSTNTICTNCLYIVSEANDYHFGILSSSIHLLWVWNISGRQYFDFRYSSNLAYNNFPWPANVSKEDKLNIEKLSKEILKIRKQHKDHSLAYLYNPDTMPDNLRKAHKMLDVAVLNLYGLNEKSTDSEILETLFSLYKKYTDKSKGLLA